MKKKMSAQYVALAAAIVLSFTAIPLWMGPTVTICRAQTPASQPTAAAAPSSPDPDSSDAQNGIVRTKTPDGGLHVYAPKLPNPPHNPRGFADYVTGDWLIDNLGSEPSIITPFLDKDAYGNDVQSPILETLLVRDPNTFEWQPWLAESYDQKADGVTIVFVLRKEATFSDGAPVTADDVVFSYNTMMDPNVDDDRYKASGSRIQSCTKIDDRTVQFKFKDQFFQALETAGGIPVIPKHIYQYKSADEYNKKTDLLIGSGPYLFDKAQWIRGQRITLVRNPNYWGHKGTFDRTVLLFLQNPQAAFQAFQNGDLDEFGPQPDQYEKYSQDPDFKNKFITYSFDRPNSGYRYIGWNEKKAVFADKETRQALTMLIDRKGIIDTIQHGMAREISGPFSPLTKQYDPSIQPLPFSPRAAKLKLKKAGWELNADGVLERNGVQFKFDLMLPADLPVYTQIAETIKNQFAKAGIIMRITPFEFSVMVDRLDNRNFDAAMLGWTGGIEEDPYQIWHSDSIKNKGSNFISWSDPEADKLIEAGRREMDEGKRMIIWHQLHAIIHDQQPYTFLAIGKGLAFINGRFKNTEPYKTGLNSGDWYVPKGQQKYH